MNRKTLSGLIACAVVIAPAAAWSGHGRPGLWKITSSMEMPNMPQMPQMPPEAMAMMKARGMQMPGMGGAPIVTEICMTQEQVNADRPPALNNHAENCTTKILNQSATSVTAETTCHGRMEGVGRSQMSWRGTDHYEGTYSFKGRMEGRAHAMTTRFTGDFVKSDCGAVKPHMPKAQ
ncbi:MAG TPA: DUF3617 domain-containing protein [Rhizomicrobium sp.]|nr:DUF3617 domain-containing protein [Rhizomicrobium sp.]HKY18285.1 DUF3617 domain-containing protein [Rhizomicrobium sp.]